MIYHLSTWQTVANTGPLGGNQQVLLLLASYPLADVNIVPGNAGRLVCQVHDPATLAALDSDYRFPQVATLAYGVEEYRQAMRHCHGLKLRGLSVTITVGVNQFTLPASREYQAYLAGLAAKASAGSPTIAVWFRGGLRQVASAAFLTAYKSYLDALANTGGVDHVSIAGAIEAAASVADLDAVVIS